MNDGDELVKAPKFSFYVEKSCTNVDGEFIGVVTVGYWFVV